MGDWGVGFDGQGRWTTNGTTTCTTGNANTKGAYAELVDSTLGDAIGILVTIYAVKINTNALIDVAIGAAGSEVVILPNLIASAGASWSTSGAAFFPIRIPKGSRISFRAQDTDAAAAVSLKVSLIYGGHKHTAPLSRVTAYGANTADSGGTPVDPGAVAYTLGAYSQITDSTTNPIRAIVIGIGSAKLGAHAGARWTNQLAIGPAGSETIILGDYNTNSAGMIYPGALGAIPIDIPVGTRLAYRTECNITGSPDRIYDVVIYGLD